MLDVTITLHGKTQYDLELAAEEVKRLLSEGYLSGMNSNDDGEFYFDVTGESEEIEEDADYVIASR